ncbi:unnamed protein product [Blepharisma stoltei]|uniref:TNFR-Cys domain-containing protein n=1 Tax=Blepharisma stoltei TaxID=1481888 RepID=A0AAU9KHH4_9CILI|nr:unnamed protein product [Blepharisma stoltei]
MFLSFLFITKIWLTFSCCPYNSLNWGALGCTCQSSSKYYADSKICLTGCPSLFSPDHDGVSVLFWCDTPSGDDAILFTLPFSTVQDVTGTYIASSTGSADHFVNPSSVSYNSATRTSPLPTLDRGFYFATTSGIIGSQSYTPALYFTLNMWIIPLSSGEILNVISGSTQYLRIYADSTSVYKYSANIYDSSGNAKFMAGTATSTYTSSWHYASVVVNQSDCDTINVSFYINGSAVGTTAVNGAEGRFTVMTYSWKIGNVTGGNSFRGFMYWLQARSDTTMTYGTTTPTVNCVYNQYWSGSACVDCDSSCPTWPWCRRGTDCGTCNTSDCSACSGYSLSLCSACFTGIAPGCCDTYGTTCTQTWSNTGKSLIGGVCLYACPYGFGNCAAVSSAVLTADFTGTFAGSYGTDLITATSSSSYNYWSSAESSDPFPAKNRGLYFNSNQYLAGSINLSNTWSMSMWAYAISGTLVSHSSNKLTIDSSGSIIFYLEKWDASSGSWSATQTITSNTWSYVSYTVGFSNKITTVTPYLNNAAGTSTSITNFVFRLPSGGTLYLGKGSTNFKGFIAHFMLWQVAINDFSAFSSIGTLTGGTVSTLWPCDYSEYYDGTNCASCLGTCTMGCTRGTSCYICDDFLCSQCTSFLSGTCTSCVTNAAGSPCTCNSGYYQPTNQAVCSPCYNGCTHCTDSSYYSCTSCSSTYFLYNSMICLMSCPSGYTENSSTKNCDFSSTTGLSLSLYDKIMLHSISGVNIGNSMSNYYPSYDSNDPYPAYLRGYYFTGTTYMSSYTVIGPYFTVSIWVYPTAAGTILAKTVSGSEIFCLEILSGSGNPKLSIILKDSSSFSVTLSENALNGSWNYIAFAGKIDASHKTTVSSYFNSLTKETGSSSNVMYFQDRSANYLYIGTKATTTSGFIGFLYDLNIYNVENLQYSDYTTSSCISSCSSCPIDHNCPDNAPITQYYDGSAYVNCMGTCTKGCRYADTCGLCKTKMCYECSFFSGSCSSCITNAEADGSGGCQCKANAFWHSSTASCDFCDALCSVCKQTTYFECTTCATGKEIVDIICLNDCPYGYETSCSSVSTAAIDLLFDTDFQGSYGIFTTGASSSTYQHFNSPETYDPIPAYARGLYFDGNMYLLSSVSVYLSHSFSMGAWIYVATNGDLLQKQTRLTFSSTGAIAAIMEDTTQATSTQTLSPTSSFAGWAYLSLTIYYTSNASVLSIYINGVSAGTTTISGKIYRDQASTNLQLGKSSTSGFVGFIYYFQLWNTQITDFLTIISGFTFCASGASCLWECSISTYKNGAFCSACNSCNKGCVRASTCNICDDLLCSVCSGFGSGKCTQCVSNASGAPAPCVCNPGYWTSNDGFSCQPCYTGCSQCTGLTYQKCTACFSGYYFFALTGQCLTECPSGYSANSAGKTCDWSSDLGIGLDLTDQVRLDTVSAFNIGSVNTNIYPDWNLDVKDPIPSYKRGYYFYQSNYLSSTVMIAPSFTISLWTKPLSVGILMTKYATNDILKITVDSLGYPSLSITFADSSSTTLTTSTSILNSWNFLSFTGEVQTDGLTKLNLYINTIAYQDITTTTLIYFKDTNAGTLYIGNDETLGTSGLYGFLARLYIYNAYTYQSYDYSSSCNTGCSVCPLNNQCLSECDFDKYPDSCIACLAGCNQGCVSDLTCRLCRDKECYSCTTFSGECASCITNAYKPVDHCVCNTNAVWVSSSQSCELCNTICDTCSTVDYNGCLTCTAGYYLIQSLCMTFCPTGYVINGNNCDADPAYTDFLVLNMMPHQIKDVVVDLASSIPVLTGKDNSFYPTYDATDPIAAIYRGYYFSGSAYMQLPPYTGTGSPLLTFSPKFTISAWINPVSDTGVVFSKQTSNGGFEKFVSFELVSKYPSLTLTLQNSNTIIYTSAAASVEVSLSQWNFISAASDISAAPQQIIKIMTNTFTDISSDQDSSWLNDLQSSFIITIGASYLDSITLTSFFNGFLWNLKIYNTITTNSLVSSSCNGCSLCPIDNSNICLESCLIGKYWNGYSCDSCLSGCSTVGCVRRDKNCNLCQDIICEICDDYTSTCISCRAHANLVGPSCQCNDGYYWNSGNEICELCNISCKTCTSPNFLDCLTCANGYYMASGICGTSCPLGYEKKSGNCIRVQEKMLDLDLNTLSGVIYDKASSIPVVTGSTKQFYPDYEADDPIPAYLRGFWFNGQSSILRLPEYSNYTSPRLVIAPTFTISIWLNIESSYSAILSKHNISDGYSTLYLISLMDSKPIFLSNLGLWSAFYICDASLKNYEWSHIAFTLEIIASGYNKLSCYVNGISYPSSLTGYGAFLDVGPHTTITIGAQISASSVYNNYQGFIYTIQMFNTVKSVSSLSTSSCTETCSACPTSQICIPNCKINQFWSGPAYNACYQCNTKCKKTCRDWKPTCSLCSNLLCDICTEYSASGCSTCKQNAINPDSCICDVNYVLDTSTNNTCIPIEAGGFRGPDGMFYSCLRYCTYCESLTSCTACVENASLNNNLCYCNLGYNGAAICSLVPFSAWLTVLSDNSLYLTFSDSLENSLSIYDFTIVIEKQGKLSYKMEQVNSTCYYLSLSITEEISKGSLVILEFLHLEKVRSVLNGVLNSSEISAALNSYDPAPYSSAVAAVASQAAASAQAAISGAIALSVVNPSPSSLWSMMNTLQILSYLTLSGIPFTSKMSSFLNNLNSFNIMPNIFSYIIYKNEGNTPYSQAKEFGYDSDLILITTGNDFTLILASLLAFPIIFFFSRCSYRWIGKKFMKTVKAYQFSFYLRFWIQSYLELGAAASIGLVTFGFNNMMQISNVIICIIIYVLLVATPPGYFWFSYINRNRIQSREKTFTALFSSFFYEFRTDRGLLATQYYFVFFIRRLIYIINLVYLRDYPQTEVTINIVLSVMVILHLIFFWPFEDSIIQICNLLSEISIFLIMSATSVYLFNLDQKIISDFENVIVGITITVMGIQAFASIAIFVRTIYEIIHHKLTKVGIVRRNIRTLKPHLKKVKK